MLLIYLIILFVMTGGTARLMEYVYDKYLESYSADDATWGEIIVEKTIEWLYVLAWAIAVITVLALVAYPFGIG